MAEVLRPIKFSRKIKNEMKDLIIPEKYVRDFHFSTDKHLMIMLRIMGPDLNMARDFFKGAQDEIFHIQTIEADDNEVSDNFRLNSIYMDEGPPISVDIDPEPEMIRLILDYEWVK
ncbi:MAG: hypothetical protein QME14_04225 [Methanobacteriaceae archaeon]|nr:hypothetical protein [Methanobacteriaceae archaeon]